MRVYDWRSGAGVELAGDFIGYVVVKAGAGCPRAVTCSLHHADRDAETNDKQGTVSNTSPGDQHFFSVLSQLGFD